MKTVARSLSFLGLALVVVPPVLFAVGSMGDALMKNALIAGTVLWFATARLWMHGSGD